MLNFDVHWFCVKGQVGVNQKCLLSIRLFVTVFHKNLIEREYN